MGLMDKVKAQAAIAAQKAQEAAQQGKDKLDQAQASRRGDAMLRQLGAVVYAERTGRGSGDTQAKIEQLISDISAHERANGLNLAGDQSQPFGQQQSYQSNPSNPFGGQSQPGQYPGAGNTSFTDTGSGPFSDAGQTSGGGQQMGHPDTTPMFFPGSHDEADGS